MLLYHISTPRNISNAASQHLLSKLNFLLKPLMLYLYKKHLVNFIIISFTIQNIDSNIIHPGKMNDWNLKNHLLLDPEKFTFHPLSTSIFEFHPFIFQGVP